MIARRNLTLIVVVVVSVVMTAGQPAVALLGLFEGGGGTVSEYPATPPAGTIVQGEAMTGDLTVVTDPDADGARYARTVTGVDKAVPASVSPGAYALVARLKADRGSRADLVINGEMVASYAVGSAWRAGRATVYLAGSSDRIGVRAFDRSGTPNPVDLDWVHLEPVSPQYTVRGTSILDPAGQRVRFRGANRVGYQNWTYGGAEYNDPRHESAPMVEWGMNVVRVELNEEFWLQDCPLGIGPAGSTVHDNPDGHRYREVIRAEVDRYVAAGLYVILDLHVTNAGNPCPDDGHVEYRAAPMPTESRSIPFWRGIAREYRDDPQVGFDLFNEPHLSDLGPVTKPPDPDSVWRDGGTVRYGVSTSRWKRAGMQDLYNAIRGQGAQNLLFVSGLHYARDIDVLMRKPLSGYGIVAATHPYCDDGCDPDQTRLYEWTFGEPAGQGDSVVGTADRFPTVATEFGATEWSPGSDSHVMQKQVDWLEAHDLGWVVYNWAPGNSMNPWGILDDVAFSDQTLDVGSRRVPNANGRPIWAALATVRG